MPASNAADQTAALRHQRELAEVLIGCHGYHGAIDECLRNGWEGVLAILLNRKAAPERASGAGPRPNSVGADLKPAPTA